jgi:hypothetical protein
MQQDPTSPRWKSILRWCYERFPASAAIGWQLCKHFYHHPIFLIGVGRSGTTVLVRALNTHPQLLAAGDAHFIGHIGEAAYQFFCGGESAACQLNSRISASAMSERLRRLAFETVLGPGYGARDLLLRRRLWRGERLRRKKYWMTNKAPMTFNAAKGLQQLYPGAKFLFVHRNGIDNVQSRTRFHGFRDMPFRTHCEAWANGMRKFLFLTTWNAALTIPHADLIDRREETFKAILEYLELEQHEGPARFAKQTLIHPLDRETEETVDASRVLVERRPAHENWSDEEKRIFRELCGDAMKELGYEIPF